MSLQTWGSSLALPTQCAGPAGWSSVCVCVGGGGCSPPGQSCQAGEEKEATRHLSYPGWKLLLHRLTTHSLGFFFFEHDENFNSIYTNITHH